MFLLLLDANCSGRTLATFLVAWVAIAMVISVLLQWRHMWIVFMTWMVLTLLFSIIFCCIGYNRKRAHWRAWFEQHRRRAEEERERRIWTTSGIRTDNNGEICSEARLADMPPSYSSVVLSARASSESSHMSPTIGESADNLKFEDPPTYASVISITNTHDRNAEASHELNIASARENNDTVSIDIPQAAPGGSETANTNSR